MRTIDLINELIAKAPQTKVAVIGDLIIDEYWHGSVNRISPEFPVPIVDLKDKTRRMGGAGNVYNNLKSLGANVSLFCNYPDTENVMWSTNESIFVNPYPCSRKVRVMAGNHQMLRVDVETPYDQIEWQQYDRFSWWRELMDTFESYDVIVLSDYSKGVLSDGVINTIIDFARISKKTIIVDAKRDLNRYYSDDVIMKCNRQEWMADRKAPPQFKGEVITEGEKGMWVHIGKLAARVMGCNVNIVDVCGAGDTVTAVLALGTGMGMYLPNAARLANLAAAEVCRHPGVVPITPDGLVFSYEQTQEAINP